MRLVLTLSCILLSLTACSSTPEVQDNNIPPNVVVSDLAGVEDITGKHFRAPLEIGEQEIILVVVNMAEKRKDSKVSLNVVDESGKSWPVVERYIFRKFTSVGDFVDADSVTQKGSGMVAAIRIPDGSAKIKVIEDRSRSSEILSFSAHAASKISGQRSLILVLLYDNKVEIRPYE
ncbi:MAG: hypothetical protein L3J82_09965 [Planctomycetes bacterium]|nr:hypothetical protein [Planctomycetota bacterium]